MSGRCTGWVLRHGPHPTMLDGDGKAYAARARGLRSVLITIADAANADGEHAHPGVPAMVDGSLYSRRQVIALAGQLEQDGWVTVEERGGGRGLATVYRVNMDRETVQSAHRSPEVNGAVVDTKRCSPEHETVQSVEPAPPYATRATVATNATTLSWTVPDAATQLDAALALCERFAVQLEERGYAGSAAKATSKRWVLDMEQLLRLDGRDVEAVRRVLDWLHAGADDVATFWRTNVRSPSKLRAQWQVMAEQYARLKTKPSGGRKVVGLERDSAELLKLAYGDDGAGPPASSALSLPSEAIREA